MKKTFLALALTAAAAVAAPALADTAPKQQFTFEGVTYTYTKTQVGDSTVYKGYAEPGYPFYLVSHRGQVTGKVNGENVSFATPKVGAETASGKQLKLAAR